VFLSSGASNFGRRRIFDHGSSERNECAFFFQTLRKRKSPGRCRGF
jgi:hypothetical protein